MDNRNIVIGLLVVIIIFLAFLAFRPTFYGPIYSQNGFYQSWPGDYEMGPGMMHGQDYDYGFGPGMKGYGDMMALYYPDAKPVSSEQALLNMERLAQQYSSNAKIEDFMAFSSNYYAVLKDADSGQGIAEILVDRYSGLARPEPGPNMMWNIRFGTGREQSGGLNLTEAKQRAEDFLGVYLPGAKVWESEAMPGYYTFDFGREGIEGMLSVNSYSGDIWVHTWHGFYLGGHDENASS